MQQESQTARFIRRHPVKSQRFFEILPGFFSWSLILFPFWGSLFIPVAVAYYIIGFCVYWLYRSLTLAVLAIVAHFRIRASSQFDWLADLKLHFPATWQSVHHIIVIPTYKEPLSTLERTLSKLAEQTFPLKNLHIMLSFEVREGAEAHTKAEQLKETYAHIFGDLWFTYHPDIAGEVKGKSSNTSWGARAAKKLLVDEKHISIEKITITSEDADALFHPSYFSALTYSFLVDPKPFNVIWQGAIAFYNNIWKVPSPVRVLAALFSVTQMYILVRQDRLINFSTYSTSLKHIHDIGYWDTDVIPEDYRLFFKSYFAKKGDFEVKPIYLPIYADAAESGSFWATMLNQYEQLKRWAWGVSDDAYIIRQYLMADEIPFLDRSVRVLKTIEDHFLWPVNWFAITISAFLPPLLNPAFNRTILGKTLPQVTSLLLTLSLVSMVVIFILDAINRPPRPNKLNLFSYIFQPLEFLLLPVIGFFFSALPGIDAHTRLMLGKYIEYKVTEKI
ncbi:glycosyltransferase family 2 protein [Candidatus Woesebacteria bacterium]|nr:glycosyltransferase family 2 protein [Candidatus Woesebacteria bacterium]